MVWKARLDFVGTEQRLEEKLFSKAKGLQLCFGIKMGKLIHLNVNSLESIP